MERLYQKKPYMVEGMYVVGVKPKSLGEGVVPVAYSMHYELAYAYWDHHPGENLTIFQWSYGNLKYVGRKIRDKVGRLHVVPVPPDYILAEEKPA